MPETTTEKPEAELCCYCGKPAEGNYSINRDDFDVGPTLPLCAAHGSTEWPTYEQIWARIAERRAKGELP